MSYIKDINKVILVGYVSSQINFYKVAQYNYATCFLITNQQVKIKDKWTSIPTSHRLVFSGDEKCKMLSNVRLGERLVVEGSIKQTQWVDKQTNKTVYGNEIRVKEVTIANKRPVTVDVNINIEEPLWTDDTTLVIPKKITKAKSSHKHSKGRFK